MRIATWNVNSLKARQEAVDNWLERAAPDILLMQETKLGDADAPVMAFGMAGYQLVHHGEGRWNGVAIAARNGLAIDDIVTNFGDGPVRDSGPGGTAGSEDDFDPFDEARVLAATVDGLRIVTVYAPNGRVVGSPFYEGKLKWFERLGRYLDDERAAGRGDQLLVGGDFNVAPTDIDVWDPRGCPRRHARQRAGARRRPRAHRPRAHGHATAPATTSPAASRGGTTEPGMFHKNFGMRIDLLLAGAAVAARLVDAEIDRQARKGPPVPSDHAPLTIDLDEPGKKFDPDWEGALARIKARTR